MFIFTIK